MLSENISLTSPKITPSTAQTSFLDTTAIKSTDSFLSVIDISSLWIDLSNPVFNDYDYMQNKRFPGAIKTVLNIYTETIISKIDANSISFNNRNFLYDQVLNILHTQLKSSTHIKEQKILQYIVNRIYVG